MSQSQYWNSMKCYGKSVCLLSYIVLFRSHSQTHFQQSSLNTARIANESQNQSSGLTSGHSNKPPISNRQKLLYNPISVSLTESSRKLPGSSNADFTLENMKKKNRSYELNVNDEPKVSTYSHPNYYPGLGCKSVPLTLCTD